MSRRRVIVLGSTGSIGTQALDVVREHPDRFELVGLASGRGTERLAAQVREFGISRVAVADPEAARRFAGNHPQVEVLDGPQGVAEIAATPADLVVNGLAGARGLEPTMLALQAGTPVALANKESLIIGGPLVVAAAEAAGGRASHLIPVDSEHSALAQCLRAGRRSEVRRLVLTASGGPFRGRSLDELARVTPDDALTHPTWSMGPLVTVNSATLMNKGLELIEAQLLFDVRWESLDVVVHPQSVVHSMVEFHDGSTVAQLSPPDMRLPIQLAMSWPERLPHAFVACDWTALRELTFEPVDHATFPALRLAEAAGREGGTFPAVLNAANETAVEAFLAGAVRFLDVPFVVESVLETWSSTVGAGAPDLGDVLAADAWGRERAGEVVRERVMA